MVSTHRTIERRIGSFVIFSCAGETSTFSSIPVFLSPKTKLSRRSTRHKINWSRKHHHIQSSDISFFSSLVKLDETLYNNVQRD